MGLNKRILDRGVQEDGRKTFLCLLMYVLFSLPSGCGLFQGATSMCALCALCTSLWQDSGEGCVHGHCLCCLCSVSGYWSVQPVLQANALPAV